MLERLQQIPPRILEWWKKFSTKQKALIISSTAVVIAAIAILWAVLSVPNMVVIKECENTTEAAEVRKILNDNGITYEVSDDALVFSVKKEDSNEVDWLLAENKITPYNYEWKNLENVFSGGFSTTEADKTKRYRVWMEDDLEQKLSLLAAVDSAQVTLNIPEHDGTLISKNEPSYAWVTLDLNSELDQASAKGLAQGIATALGNENTDTITILDTNGNTVFIGGQDESSIATANNNLDVKAKAENRMAEQVRKLMMETKQYNTVSVMPNLDIEYTDSTSTNHRIYTDPSLEGALPSQTRTYDQTMIGGMAAVPGTDANDDDTYVTEDGATTQTTTSETETTYQNSEEVITSSTSSGRPNYETSSIAVMAANYRTYNEDELRASGQLDNMTFEEFQATVEERTRLEVDPDIVAAVSNATGIPEANVSVVAYEIAMFNASEKKGFSVTDYLPIALAVLIMVMLGFVVLRSTRKERQPEPEPELSVENLLETTKQVQEEELEDIGYSEKSETRILIEKFVDENPEAVAALLRNWLNEEWD